MIIVMSKFEISFCTILSKTKIKKSLTAVSQQTPQQRYDSDIFAQALNISWRYKNNSFQ